MFSRIPTLQKLLEISKKIPYVPSKHLYHLVESILNHKNNELEFFFNEILSLKNKLIICQNCYAWKEINIDCYWCHSNRDQSVLCIVETWIDALALERAKIFQGIYHILGGNVSPLDGITPDQLHFDKLTERIESLPLVEIIIATNQTPEGEATASYIERIITKCNKKNIIISYLATGIPVGTSLEYVDKLTIAKAISFRRKIL
jgi:recombination protein RecR